LRYHPPAFECRRAVGERRASRAAVEECRQIHAAGTTCLAGSRTPSARTATRPDHSVRQEACDSRRTSLSVVSTPRVGSHWGRPRPAPQHSDIRSGSAATGDLADPASSTSFSHDDILTGRRSPTSARKASRKSPAGGAFRSAPRCPPPALRRARGYLGGRVKVIVRRSIPDLMSSSDARRHDTGVAALPVWTYFVDPGASSSIRPGTVAAPSTAPPAICYREDRSGSAQPIPSRYSLAHSEPPVGELPTRLVAVLAITPRPLCGPPRLAVTGLRHGCTGRRQLRDRPPCRLKITAVGTNSSTC